MAQVCSGMAYLEKHNYIMGPAARNCLVGEQNVVKADFGLASMSLMTSTPAMAGLKFPIKWSPPEVLNFTRFPPRAMCGRTAYRAGRCSRAGDALHSRAKNPRWWSVQRGQILPMPPNCPGPVYEEVMRFAGRHFRKTDRAQSYQRRKLTVITRP